MKNRDYIWNKCIEGEMRKDTRVLNPESFLFGSGIRMTVPKENVSREKNLKQTALHLARELGYEKNSAYKLAKKTQCFSEAQCYSYGKAK